MIYRKRKTILILLLVSSKRYFSHPYLKSSLTLRRGCNFGPRTTVVLKSKILILQHDILEIDCEGIAAVLMDEYVIVIPWFVCLYVEIIYEL